MRIIGGTWGGRVIQAPGNLPVRPTTDFAKSGLFNILSNYVEFNELRVLDLFSGIGSIGLEFASRGAREVVCVDEHAACVKFIRETCERLAVRNLSTRKSDVFSFLETHSEKFELIFADPPFEWSETDRLPDLILHHEMLASGGWLIIEHQSKRILQSQAVPFQVRKYGNCAFSFYHNT